MFTQVNFLFVMSLFIQVFVNMKNWLVLLLLVHACVVTNHQKLSDVTKHLGSINVLHYEPSPEDFYQQYVHTSTPVLIRPKSHLWQNRIAKITPDVILQHLQNIHGKAYQRSIWTTGWPVEVRHTFKEFLKQSIDNHLYWDSTVPINSTLLKHFPLPFSVHCEDILNKFVALNLLYTHHNASSVFHQDGSENLFLQLSGKKTWLLANFSFTEHAYADSYTLQAGLSPINPEEVNITKYPLVSDIEFYNITTIPGDLLYVPQYWWHYVTSTGSPNIGLNYWFDVFALSDLENSFGIVDYVEKFAEVRKATANFINCTNFHAPLSAFPFKGNRKGGSTSNAVYNIYFGSDDGIFYVLNSAGILLWKHQTESDAGSTPALNSNDTTVFFAGEDSGLYAFDALTGTLLWVANLDDGVTAAVRFNSKKDTVYVASLDKNVYAFLQNGTNLWKAGPFHGELWASPYVNEKSVVICTMAESHDSSNTQSSISTVVKLDSASGKVLWKHATNGPVFASPAVPENEEYVVVSSYDNNIYVLDFTTGLLVWNLDIGDYCNASPAISKEGSLVFFTTTTGVMMCIDIKSQTLQWKKQFHGTDVLSSPLLTDKHLFQAINSNLFALDPANGQVMWKFAGKQPFISSPRLDKFGTLYIGCNDNNFYAINATTGKKRWHFSTEGAVVGSAMFSSQFMDKSSSGGLL